LSRTGSRFWRRPLVLALIVPVAGFELCVGWLALHPQVSDGYRAYYIDQTSTCLDKGASGQYPLGQTISFLPDNIAGAARLRVCGWDGPVADGTHSLGTRSLLRFAIPEASGELILRLQMAAITTADGRAQRVVLSANGFALGEVTIPPGATRVLDLPISEALLGPGRLDIALDYPNAAEMVPHDSDIHLRAIKLLSVQLRRLEDPPSSGPQDDPDAQRSGTAAG